jgi:hypothetical protein
MPQTSRNPWADWLLAERADALESADAALREAFADVPRRSPSVALHDRLLQMTVSRRAGMQRRQSETWVAAGVILAAFAFTVTPLAIIVGLFLINPGRVAASVAQTCVWLSEWVNAGASVWTLAAQTGTALGRAAASPSGSMMLTMSLIIASTALLALNRYMTVERS